MRLKYTILATAIGLAACGDSNNANSDTTPNSTTTGTVAQGPQGGSCHAVENTDSFTIACDDGSSVNVPKTTNTTITTQIGNGEKGDPGTPGKPGPAGPGARVVWIDGNGEGKVVGYSESHDVTPKTYFDADNVEWKLEVASDGTATVKPVKTVSDLVVLFKRAAEATSSNPNKLYCENTFKPSIDNQQVFSKPTAGTRFVQLGAAGLTRGVAVEWTTAIGHDANGAVISSQSVKLVLAEKATTVTATDIDANFAGEVDGFNSDMSYWCNAFAPATVSNVYDASDFTQLTVPTINGKVFGFTIKQ